MVVKLKISIPEGAMLCANLAASGQVTDLGIDENCVESETTGQASLGFIRNQQNSGYFYHTQWQQNGNLRYFVHSQPYDAPHMLSSTINATLYCIENDGFKRATIDLQGDFLQRSSYAPEAAVGMIYGGLKTYAKSHIAYPNEPLELTLDLGEHTPALFGMLLADILDQGQTDSHTDGNSSTNLHIQPVAHKLFGKNTAFNRNSPTMHTFLSIVDGIIYCDPIVARMLRGARGVQGSDEAGGGNLVADLQRAGKQHTAPAIESQNKNTYPESIVDAFNNRQWQILLSKITEARMTYYTEISIGSRATKALAHWLAPQIGVDWTSLQRLMDETFQGSVEADLHYDDHGFIVGAVIKRSSANSPRGTTYEIGDTKTLLAAKGIWLANLSRTESSLKFSPTTYSWIGARGRAHAAFQRWFNHPDHETIRQHTISFDYFKNIMSSRPSIAVRMAAVDSILENNSQLKNYVARRFAEITFNTRKTFERCLEDIRDPLRQGEDPKPAFYFIALYIELSLREVVGDDVVDQAIAKQR